ncbi:MAG TPA: PIN domain-containing protein [Terriglobales bacterium]|nr:PIN domain-containing protein [Terriglobales bacterium]
MRRLVLDAWAVMAWLNGQPGGEAMREIFRAAERTECVLRMSIINLGEVFYSAARCRGLGFAQEFAATLRRQVVAIPASEEAVMRAAALKAFHKLSFADAFAVVAALDENAPLVTGDPELRALERKLPGFRLEWVGRT